MLQMVDRRLTLSQRLTVMILSSRLLARSKLVVSSVGDNRIRKVTLAVATLERPREFRFLSVTVDILLDKTDIISTGSPVSERGAVYFAELWAPTMPV